MSTIEKALAKKKENNQEQEIKVSVQNSEIATDKPNTPAKSSSIENKPVIEIDTNKLLERGFLIDTGIRKTIKEEFREIKRKLLKNAFGATSKTLKHSNLIMVSSANPNEGKSFVAINLALSLALEKNTQVLLVDADVLKPSVNVELAIKTESGLIDYLQADDMPVKDIIFDTSIKNLKILPAGDRNNLATELLSSEKMAVLAHELSSRYPDRIVVFDCPPLLGVSESVVIASLVGQILLVAEESKTPIADIQEVTQFIAEDKALGIILNKSVRKHKELYGYYGQEKQ